ncbi:MAG: phosphoribosylaminoimidazolesuccinocarboxamide synthase [Ichthyobacteriaceae bacterium]|nr:phosphoribosylaminoimidazolesuccinocarboxamide synthase [Ichthyobacteriaceae bacterium]
MAKAIVESKFEFEGQKSVYNGKVRDVYSIDGDLLAMVVSDRLSAFDVVLPKGIPYKGQVLNQIAEKALKATEDIVPNWIIAVPDANVTIGKFCEPFKVEMVIRGYLTGHAWREYKAGKRVLCGVELEDGLVENQKFNQPKITPTTKADNGEHDMDISKEDILLQGVVSADDYAKLEEYTYKVFARGTEIAKEKGLILVDTKYEFGKTVDGEIILIDEIHTPDSSRYFYADGYENKLANGVQQRQLSKEFVRQWLIENNFQGQEGQVVPDMSDEFVESVSERYIELYEKITGDKFVKADVENINNRIDENVNGWLKANK